MLEQDTDKIKICKLCNKEINLDSDDYVRVTDYKKGQELMEGFYHKVCYLDRINKGLIARNKGMMEMAARLAGRANRLLDKTVGEEDKEYVIT